MVRKGSTQIPVSGVGSRVMGLSCRSGFTPRLLRGCFVGSRRKAAPTMGSRRKAAPTMGSRRKAAPTMVRNEVSNPGFWVAEEHAGKGVRHLFSTWGHVKNQRLTPTGVQGMKLGFASRG